MCFQKTNVLFSTIFSIANAYILVLINLFCNTEHLLNLTEEEEKQVKRPININVFMGYKFADPEEEIKKDEEFVVELAKYLREVAIPHFVRGLIFHSHICCVCLIELLFGSLI